MKKLSLLLFMTVAFVACGKKDDKKNDLSAPSITCLQQHCDNSTYANNSQFGFSTFNDTTWGNQPYLLAAQMNNYSNYYSGYNTTYNTSYYNNGYSNTTFQNGYFCGCSVGFTPVYNSAAGFGCVNSRVIVPVASTMMFWSIQSNQQAFSEFTSATAAAWIQQSASYTGNKCSNFVGEACLVNQPEACRTGTCQATVPGSTLGICVK